MTPLTISEVKELIGNAIGAFPHEECSTCECFIGYVTQLEMDSDQTAQLILEKYKPSRGELHSCLGCDPCPPGDHYAQYLRSNRGM